VGGEVPPDDPADPTDGDGTVVLPPPIADLLDPLLELFPGAGEASADGAPAGSSSGD
jgi:hypothetical protein